MTTWERVIAMQTDLAVAGWYSASWQAATGQWEVIACSDQEQLALRVDELAPRGTMISWVAGREREQEDQCLPPS